MSRCGITRQDGVVRIGILCDKCAVQAMVKLQEAQRRFWAKAYDGPEPCEACRIHEYNENLIKGDTNG